MSEEKVVVVLLFLVLISKLVGGGYDAEGLHRSNGTQSSGGSEQCWGWERWGTVLEFPGKRFLEKAGDEVFEIIF